MPRESVDDLLAFIAVARERSFTKAAAQFGLSQSALSHTIRQLEARLGIRLLTRTTRAVSLTDAGERLFNGIRPHFEEIGAQIDALSELREKPAGNIRVTASDHAVTHVLWPKLRDFLPKYPDIKVELVLDNALIDIVATRCDAGVRMGELLAKDMISARISPPVRFAVIGTPAYFDDNPIPASPQELVHHNCINLRLPTYGGLWAWEFEREGQTVNIRVDGQVAFNNIHNVLEAALDGFGLAYVPEDIASPHIAQGRLMRVLEDWSPYWESYHLYYPSRRQSSPAFIALVEALRHRE